MRFTLRSPPRLLALSAVLVALALIAVVALMRARHQMIPAGATPVSRGTAPATSQIADQVAEGLDRFLRLNWVSGLKQAEAARIANLTVQFLRAYTADTDEEFVRLLERQGLKRGKLLGDDPTLQWQLDTSALRGASVDASSIAVRVVCQNGHNRLDSAANGLEVGQLSMDNLLKEPRSEADVQNAFSSNLTVVEVSLSGSWSNYKGRAGRGTLCFYFAQRPRDREWILVGTRLLNLPMRGDGGIYFCPPIK